MTTLAPWLVLASLMAGPPSDLPQLLPRTSGTVQSTWEAVKGNPDRAHQLERIDRENVDRLYCTDLISLTDVMALTDLPLDLRDNVRGRVAARPEMITLIAGALAAFRQDYPTALVRAGDIAQPGCGQIRYGTVVSFLTAEAATPLRDAASLRFGTRGLFEAHPPEDFFIEHPRFTDELGPVWVERTLTGETREGLVRVEMRRFDAGRVLSGASLGRLIERTRTRARTRTQRTWDRVWHEKEDGEAIRLWRVTWHHPRTNRWMEAVLRPGIRRTVNARTLLRVREAKVDPKKPLSYRGEERYLFEWDGEAGVRVRRHLLHYEAHHTSHLGGFDADLSYITKNNENHFNPDVAVMDAKATWFWLKALYEAARRYDVPLTALFVDRAILTMLRSVPEASARDPLWRKLRRSPGHDSHVHIRIGRNRRIARQSVQDILTRVGALLPLGANPAEKEATEPE